MPEPVPIADLTLHPLKFGAVVDWIVQRALGSQGGVVCTPNADYAVRAHKDASFRRAIQSADIRVPDGMWIVYASRIAGRGIRHTVTGRLLLPAVAARAAQAGLPIALYGAGPMVAAEAAARLQTQNTGLDVAVAITPPFGLTIGSDEDDVSVERLKASGARIIFVALGAPKQELWMERRRDDLPGVVLVGVGAAFDIVAGRFREAPPWMTQIGMEWLFRLWQEPRRLVRRYLIDDPWILVWAIRARLGVDKSSHPGGIDARG